MLDFLRSLERDHPRSVQFGALGLWFFISLLQAITTELAHDEAYIWMYSQNLAWGYFHQPPLLAVMIKIGTSILGGEIGVRLLTVFMSTATIWLISKLAKCEQSIWFYLLAFSVPLLNVQGFFTSPDVPLMFFGALILYVAQWYSVTYKWKHATVLAVLAALILYSKYHGILVLLALVLSNPRSLIKPSFWFMTALICLAMLPHLFWQIDNDYPTIQYNWSSRMNESMQIGHVLSFVGGTILIMGPVVFISLLLTWKKAWRSSEFRNAFGLLLTVLIFFFIQSFRGRVEANWASLSIIPALIIAGSHFNSLSEKVRRRLVVGALSMVVLVVPLRVYLAVDEPLIDLGIKEEFHGWEDWATCVAQVADEHDAEAVFINTYKYPAKYTFYSGRPSTSYNTAIYAGNDYDNFDSNDALFGKQVVVLSAWEKGEEIPLPGKGQLKVSEPKEYRNYNQLRIDPECLPDTVSGDSLKISIQFKDIKERVSFKPGDILEYEWFNSSRRRIVVGKAADLYFLDSENSLININIPVPDYKGTSMLTVSIRPVGFSAGKNFYNHWLVIE